MKPEDDSLPEYPRREIVDKIVTDELTKLVMAMFPSLKREAVQSDVKMYVISQGIGQYHAGLGEYIMSMMSTTGSEKETAALNAVIGLTKQFFPNGYTNVTEKDIESIFKSTGYGEWPQALYDYIVKYGSFDESDVDRSLTLTFQEVSELVSLLPARAPKELNVRFTRDDSGRLEMEYIGKIDVARTAGRKEQEQ